MTTDARDDLEQTIRRLIRGGGGDAAVTTGLRGYGPEIYSFLLLSHRDEEDANEVFSRFAEKLWLTIGSYRGECSFRTWSYMLARGVALNFHRDSQRRAAVETPMPEGSKLSKLPAIAAEVRAESASYLRSDRRELLTALRDSLPLEDQEILVLHVDRRLRWNDVARIMHGDDLSKEDFARAQARLRKRYQLLKEHLRDAGRRAGILGERDDRR